MLLDQPRRIAVFRALQLGDLLCTIPALRALRATCPHAHVTLVGLPSMEGFAARYPRYVDDFVAFPGAPGFPEQPERPGDYPAFVDGLRRRRLDLAIQLHGDGTRSNPIVRGFGARASAGFWRDGADAIDGLRWNEHDSEVLRALALMTALGAPASATADVSLELPIADDERLRWQALRQAHALVGGPLVCIHPGARWPSRRWPLERFAAVAADLAGRGARIVVTGSDDERDLAASLTMLLRARRATVVDLSGRTTLGVLGALLEDSRLLVCNDTGISHVAAALKVPSVVIASGSDVPRWAPLDTERHRVLWHDVPCRPCGYRDCPIGHPCALGVSVDAVLDAALAHDASLESIGDAA